MAIAITDLSAEMDLLVDQESYLSDLSEIELNQSFGGATPATIGAYALTSVLIFGAGAGFGALTYNFFN